MNINQPGIEILSNLALFISGAFFLVPGFFTDFIGALLLLPPIRIFIIKSFVKKAYININKHRKADSKHKDYIDIDSDN